MEPWIPKLVFKVLRRTSLFGGAALACSFVAGCLLPPKPAPVESLAILKPFIGKTVVWHGKPVGDKGLWFLQTEYGAVEVDRMWDYEEAPMPFTARDVVTIIADIVFVEDFTVGEIPAGVQTNLADGEKIAAHYLLANVHVIEVNGARRSSPVRVADRHESEAEPGATDNPDDAQR